MNGEIDSLLEGTIARIRDRKLLLLLDYDGTLTGIAPRPELALPSEELLLILARLTKLADVDAVVISGRPLRGLMELLPISGLNFIGSHGAEGLIGGKPWTLNVDAENCGEQEELQKQLLSKLAGLNGWWLETKPLGFALHYRQAEPAEETRIISVLESWLAKVDRSGRHQVLQGKKVMEILPRGVSKGAAIQEILLLPGFSEHFPVYLGDDVTDESAFQVLQGRGLTVKVGGGQGATAANYSLANPTEVRLFLATLAIRLEEK